MTLKTWKKEFYPITAKRAARGSIIKAVEHSLRKWEGLRKSNLRAHGLIWIFGDIKESDALNLLNISASSCSLCQKFEASHWGECNGCPLYESRGRIRCDRTGDDVGNPYGTWIDAGDPRPMISALRKALKWAKEHA